MEIAKEGLTFVFLADRQDAISTVAKWYYEEWGKVPGNSVTKTIERIKGKLNRDKPPFHILAVSQGRGLGVAQLKLREMSIYPEREFWLGSLYVAPEFRGCGVGAALAQRIATIAKDLGVEELYLQTEALDGGLYQNLGWHILEEVKYNNVRVGVMVRQLNT
jgi:GNAT superfamily N-acetyltransferase